MPINAGYEYYKATEKYDKATTVREKLVALQEMRSAAPKHKGAENLRAEISLKIAKLKKEEEKQAKVASKKGKGATLNVKKEGAGQIVIIGLPNSGKSWLLKELTGVDVEIAPYQFTTKKPQMGMMNYKGAWAQLVEVPAIVEGSSQGRAQGTQLISVVRNSDAVVLLARNAEEEKIVRRELEKSNIMLGRKRPKITIQTSTELRGLSISGKRYLKIPEKQLLEFLKSMGIHKASIILEEETTLEKVALALDQKVVYKNALVMNAFEKFDKEKIKEKIFSLLEKVLVYTKKPGMDADLSVPMVMKKGSTVEDVARVLHKDFAKYLKYVRVWGSSKFAGQRVSKDYLLHDGDIIEISSG